jgi:hypothetical protein
VPPPITADSLRPQVALPPPVTAQVASEQDVEGPRGVAPGGAFLRALLVPGWGHAAVGAHARGGVYLAAEGGTAWMLLKTRSRLADARRAVELSEGRVRVRLAYEGVIDPLEVEAALEEDEGVQRARGLEEARRQQFQDWTALGIFLILMSGADAYVSAHLRDFPTPVELAVTPLPRGRVEVGARIPLRF